MANPSQGIPPGWQELISWLEEATLWGTIAKPMPQSVKDIARQLDVTLSDDPTLAFLELMALTYPLELGAREIPLSGHQELIGRPAPVRQWSVQQVNVLNRILTYPKSPGLKEASWLLQRNEWPWPEATIPALLDLVDQHPDLWAVIGEAWPPLAQWLAHQLGSKSSSFPIGPPDPRTVALRDWPVYLYRWFQHQPESALEWMLAHHQEVPEETWEPWLECYGSAIPEGILPLLIVQTPFVVSAHLTPWLRARVLSGDTVLIQEVMDRVRPKINLHEDTFELVLPPGGPEWWWTGMPGQTDGFRRKSAFIQLVSCLPPDTWTAWFERSPDDLMARFFSSPDAATLVPAVYLQLKSFPAPQWCLSFLNQRLQFPEMQLPGLESNLTRHIPSPDLATLVEAHIRTARYQLIPGSPAWNLLLSPHLYWTESLLEAVIQAFQQRPALAYEAAIDESFFTALAWRGSLGGLIRRAQRDGMRQVFPAPFSRLAPHILEVMECRKALHVALTHRESHIG